MCDSQPDISRQILPVLVRHHLPVHVGGCCIPASRYGEIPSQIGFMVPAVKRADDDKPRVPRFSVTRRFGDGAPFLFPRPLLISRMSRRALPLGSHWGEVGCLTALLTKAINPHPVAHLEPASVETWITPWSLSLLPSSTFYPPTSNRQPSDDTP